MSNKILPSILLCLFLLSTVQSMEISYANSQIEVKEMYEHFSYKPLVHLIYNHHFKKSNGFLQLEAILSQLYDKRKDYLGILYSDCDATKQQPIIECEQFKKSKDAHIIYITIPQSQFRKIGNLKIQTPPDKKQMVMANTNQYTVQAFQNFLNTHLPQFYEIINNEEEYQQFLKPKYVPKLILFQNQDEGIKRIYRQISVAYALRFDMGMISDLSDELLAKFEEVKSFPTLAILKFNFQTKQNQIVYLKDENYDETEEEIQITFHRMKVLLDKYALKQPRNDRIFHKIAMEKSVSVSKVQKNGELMEKKQSLEGWSMIFNGASEQISQKIAENSKKYDRYFNYIHFNVKAHPETVQIYSPLWDMNFQFGEEGPQMNTLGVEQSITTIQYWVKKDFIVLVVPQKNGYICGITEKALFKQNTQCIVISEESQSEVQKSVSFQIKQGLIVGLLEDPKMKMKTMKAANIPGKDYEKVYNVFSQIVKQKITQTIVHYLTNPLRQVSQKINLQELCDHPTKNCGFLLTDKNKKDKTIASYVKYIAFDYINSLDFYEVDFESNKQLMEVFGGERNKKSDIVIYNPRKKEFARLEKKLTRPIIQQFIKDVFKKDKEIKFRAIQNPEKYIVSKKIQEKLENDQL